MLFVIATVGKPEASADLSFIGVIHSGAASSRLFETGINWSIPSGLYSKSSFSQVGQPLEGQAACFNWSFFVCQTDTGRSNLETALLLRLNKPLYWLCESTRSVPRCPSEALRLFGNETLCLTLYLFLISVLPVSGRRAPSSSWHWSLNFLFINGSLWR